MNWRLLVSLLVVLAAGGGAAFFLLHSERGHGAEHDGHDHGATTAAGPERGPHGGRLLRDGDFTLELALFERGVPPEFRAWSTRGGKAVAPADVTLTVDLKRPDGSVDAFTFSPAGEFARGSGEVAEPHSFDYTVVAVQGGRTHRWQFAAPDLQTTLTAEAARRSGVAVEAAGPAVMADTLGVYGQVKVNTNKVGRAGPRFGGIVREARKLPGETVTAGEVLAVVETNQSLVRIDVTAPLAGTIVERNAHAGETVGDGAPLYTIADFSEVWIDLHIPRREQARVKAGLPVRLHADDGGPEATSTIAWLPPLGDAESQSAIARIVLPNPDGRWRPGLFVKAEITIAETRVPVAVRESGLQTVFDFTVVFSQHGDVYQARPLQLGRRSGGKVEVLKGLRAGERYVVENSFLLKADLGKAGASHDH